MITEVENRPESTATLVSGIVDDFRDLVKNELHWAHMELMDNLRKAREAGFLWALGMGLGALSALSFVGLAVFLLHTLTSPAGSDPAAIPMWACFAIVGVVLAVPAIYTLTMSKKLFDAINPMEQAGKEVSRER